MDIASKYQCEICGSGGHPTEGHPQGPIEIIEGETENSFPIEVYPLPPEAEAIEKRWGYRHGVQEWGKGKVPDPWLYEYLKNHPLPPHSKVADLGCGDGRHMVPLMRDYQAQVTGVDVALPGLKQLQKNLESEDLNKTNSDARLIRADLHNLYFLESSSFDSVISIHVLHNNSPEGLQQCVKEMGRILKPDGTCFIKLRSMTNKLPEGYRAYSRKTTKGDIGNEKMTREGQTG